MARPTHTRELGLAPTVLGRSRRLSFELVDAGNEWEIRRLLQETVIPGWIELAYEREPDYLLGCGAEGPLQQTVIARDIRDGSVVGSFSRSVRMAYVNGEARQLGYLGLLRLARQYRGRIAYLRDGYEACRRYLHSDGATPYYLTSIINDNHVARRVLTAGVPGLPVYRPLDQFVTLALTGRYSLRRPTPQLTLEPADASCLPEVAQFLARQYRLFQCAPVWQASELATVARTPGLQATDFLLARRGSELAGCAALWDQGGYKQHVVRGYAPALQRWRGLINRGAPLLALPRLPDPGQPLRQASLSHFAVRDNDPDVAVALVSALLREAHARRIPLVTLGLSEANPVLPAIRKRFRHLDYPSTLYLVYWPDGEHEAQAVRPGPAHVEMATL